MIFILTENRQIVHLYTPWKQRMIQSELNDLEVDFKVPPVEQGYIKLNDNFEIIPVVSEIKPQIDLDFQEYAGPFFTYNETTVDVVYTVQDRSIDGIKQTLKDKLAVIRYTKEIAGTKATVQNNTVTIDTSRDGRNIFVQKYALMGANDTVMWKFPETWLNLTKNDLGQIVTQGAEHIQSQFNWEQSFVAQIDAAQEVATLIEIKKQFELEVNPQPQMV